MGKVSIVRTSAGVEKSIVRVLDLIGRLGQFISHHDSVMLKPNVNGTEAVTNPLVAESLIKIIIGYGVRKLVIAESTFGNARMTDAFFEKTGYRSLAEKYGVELLNLNKSDIVDFKVKEPLILDNLKIAKEVFDGYKIINIPVMKVHYATGVSLSMKNLKGFLVGDEKRHFHEVGLEKAIVDLNNSIKPALNIIDCTECMERMGPRGGDIVKMNLIIAGGDCAEADYVGCRVMGYMPEEVKHLAYYLKMNNVDLNKIEIKGERIEDVKYNFKKVEMDRLIPAGFRIEDKNSCCACMNALFLSCQFLEGNTDFMADIYMGSGNNSKNGTGRLQIGFGNCACRSGNFDAKIKGCPPFPFALKEALDDK